MSASTKTVDPILMSVLARTFRSITDEMRASVVKTTRSPILCEAKDFVTGLYDAHGNMLEQTENLPILAFSLGPVCKHLVRYFGDDIHEGDLILHNYPALGGSHAIVRRLFLRSGPVWRLSRELTDL